MAEALHLVEALRQQVEVAHLVLCEVLVVHIAGDPRLDDSFTVVCRITIGDFALLCEVGTVAREVVRPVSVGVVTFSEAPL